MFQEQARGATFALPSSADKMYFMFLLSDSAQNPSSQQSQIQRVSQPNPIFEHIKTLSVQDSQHSNSSLLVFCPSEVQPERATSWLKGLMHVVQPQHILVTASLPVRPSDNHLHVKHVRQCMRRTLSSGSCHVRCSPCVACSTHDALAQKASQMPKMLSM